MKSNLKTSLLNLIFFLFISITAFGQTYVTISTSGTWTVPAGVTSITVRTWGGGGGGGGAASGSSAGAGGGGGGGGAYSIQTFTVSPSQTYNITIGNGGSAGNTSGTSGTAGGLTTFTGPAGTCSAAGGALGVGGTGEGSFGGGGLGGSTGTGFLYKGGNGATSIIGGSRNGAGGGGGGAGNGGAGSNGTSAANVQGIGGAGGIGGVPPYPGGAGGNAGSNSGTGGPGVAGNIPGGGGGGSASFTSGIAGAAGARGQVVISYIPCISPSITAQPNSSNICDGGTASMNIGANGDLPLNYQWQLMGSNCSSPSSVGTNATNFSTGALTPGTYYYSCSVTNVCGSLTSNCATIIVSPFVPATPGTISGLSTICSGLIGQVYSVSPVAEALSYNWTVPTGWIITNGANTNSITVTTGTQSGDISVTASNGCGTSSSNTMAVNTLTSPATSASSNGPVCLGTALNLNGGPAGMDTYTWTGPNFTDNTQSLQVSTNATALMAGNYTLNVISPNGCVGTASTSVNIITVPIQPTGFAGTANPQIGSSQTYSVTNVAGVIYNWSFPAGWVQTAGGTSNSVTVTVGMNNGNIIVTPSNTCGNGSVISTAVTVNLVTSYSSTSTWTCPAGVYSVIAECWGGGGAGGAATGNPAGGGGGAGGAYTKNTSIPVTPGTQYTVNVGGGGTIVTGGAGNTGGSSWFINNTTILAIGGGGGAAATVSATSAAGAIAATSGNIGGTTNFYGGAGGTGASGTTAGGGGSSAGTASNGNNGIATTGGTAVAGGGAGANAPTGGAVGVAGSIPGGGGSGGRASSSTDRQGGAGAAGKVIITANTITSVLTANPLSSFGPVCINTSAGPNSFTINGTGLTSTNITVGALNGYSYSTTFGGPFTSSLSLAQPGGNYSQIIYVQFNPTLAQSYNGNIAVGGGGAPSISILAMGSGISLATPGALSSNSPQCEGTGITFTSNCSNGTCYWVSSATGTETVNSSTTYTTPTTPGIYNVWVRAFDGNCWSTAVNETGTITPSVSIPVFAMGATSVRCQDTGSVTYTATANNTSGIVYSLDINSTNGGNSINPSTGEVTYFSGWSGTSIITATAPGCNGPIADSHTVTINPMPVAPGGNTLQVFLNGASVADLVSIGTDIRWYNAPTGGSIVLLSDSVINGNTYYASQTISGCESHIRLDVNVMLVYIKFINLHFFLEGLFDASTNTMFEAKDGNSGLPQWGPGIADRVQVDLFQENPPYAPIGVSISGIDLTTTGLATFQVSPTWSGNYYIRIRNRNHLETWSAIAVPFNTNNVDYNFTTGLYQAYGGNPQALVSTTPPLYAFYLGDLDQGGWIDAIDFNMFEPELTMGTTGFTNADFDGGGWVDAIDFNMFEPRLTFGNSSEYPAKK